MVGSLVHTTQEGESVSFNIWLQTPQTQSKEEKSLGISGVEPCGSARRVAKPQNTRRRRAKDKRNVWSNDD